MILPDAEWQHRPGMDKLLRALGADSGDTRYVGGCVRDTLLGLDVSDVDLATRLVPDDVLRRLTEAGIKAVPTGLAHGTVTAVVAGTPVEVTTLRRDVATDGRRATVAFTRDWTEDAARRDFTINALSADPVSRQVHDYFGGAADLEARRVRFIGDPLVRIAEDHLRILRFFRFHARFGRGEPDPAGLEACARRTNDLMALSRERIAGELLRLLALPDPAPTVRLMIAHGILKPVLPEVVPDAADRLERLVLREREAGVDGNAIRRFAALLPADPAVAGGVAARLRLSNKQAQRLASAIEDRIEAPQRLAYRIGVEEAIDRLLLHEGDPADAQALIGWQVPRLPLGGGDIVQLGIAAGPEVARLLRKVEAQWMDEGFPDAKRARRILRELIG